MSQVPHENRRKVIRDNVCFKKVECMVDVYKQLSPTVAAYIHCQKPLQEPLSLVVFSIGTFDLESLLSTEKRSTDKLVTVKCDTTPFYFVICPDTPVEGAFFMARRILRFIKTKTDEPVYIVAADIRTHSDKAGYIVLDMVSTLYKIFDEKREGEVVLRSFL